MPGEITLYESVRAVAVTVGAVAAAYKASRVVNRTKLEEARLLAEESLVLTTISMNGRFFRANIEEIIKTQRLIDSENLSGRALDRAMENLDRLSRANLQIIDRFN